MSSGRHLKIRKRDEEYYNFYMEHKDMFESIDILGMKTKIAKLAIQKFGFSFKTNAAFIIPTIKAAVKRINNGKGI